MAHDSRSDDGVAPLGVRAVVGRAFRPESPVQNKVRQAAALENGKQPWCRVGSRSKRYKTFVLAVLGETLSIFWSIHRGASSISLTLVSF